MPRTGFIDHIGIGVPDLVATEQYYDELMSILGLREWFATGPGGPLNYGPDGDRGSQLFFYQADESGTYSRRQPGLHHLASWSRVAPSSGKHTHGRSHGRQSSWTNHRSSPSTGSTAMRPTGSIRTDSSSRRSATAQRRARAAAERRLPRLPSRARSRSCRSLPSPHLQSHPCRDDWAAPQAV